MWQYSIIFPKMVSNIPHTNKNPSVIIKNVALKLSDYCYSGCYTTKQFWFRIKSSLFLTGETNFHERLNNWNWWAKYPPILHCAWWKQLLFCNGAVREGFILWRDMTVVNCVVIWTAHLCSTSSEEALFKNEI